METEDESAAEELKQGMFRIIVMSKDVFYKSQQKDEPELTPEQKMGILHDTLAESRSKFLFRYGKHMQKEHLELFEGSPDFEVRHHLKEIRYWIENRERLIRNRRFMALQEMIQDGDYFSETQMMRREPTLYENLVGQYLTEEEKRTRDFEECPGNSLVGMIYQGLDNDSRDQTRRDENVEEFDSDSDAEKTCDEDPYETPFSRQQWGNFEEGRLEFPSTSKFLNRTCEPTVITAPEKALLRDEFKGVMYSNFLAGKDKTFDYSTVDEESRYDDEEMRDRDLEDKYFDSEETEDVSVQMQQDSEASGNSEDALEVYMRHLEQETHGKNVDEIADKLELLQKE